MDAQRLEQFEHPPEVAAIPGCPPRDSRPTNDVVYRVTKKNPPSERDLKTHHERGCAPRSNPCGDCGLSVMLDEADLDLFHQKLPGLGKFVYKAELGPDNGTMKVVGGVVESHTNVWFFKHCTPAARAPLFKFHREFER